MEVIDSLRKIIKESVVSRYRVSKDTGIDQAILSRFVNGERGLNMQNIDTICRYFKLELRPKGKRKER